MAPALPVGTLTFLFTDVEGSTQLLHACGDPEAYGALLEDHRRLLRDAVGAHRGIEFGTGGDAVFVVFEAAADAVEAATDAQRAIEAHPWPDDRRIRVRMGLHTGEARVVDGDYVGMALHVTARLCSAGHGGQVLVSSTTVALAPHAPVLTLGTHHLRDVPEPMPVHQLAIDGIQSTFPPLRTQSAVPNNLPAARDRFIGRELDVVSIVDALEEHRLVTLAGPGGVGKTRLALAVAEDVLSRFSGGVWLVALGGIERDDDVGHEAARVFGVEERSSEPVELTLGDRLADRDLLVVLDNCEHVLDGVATLVGALLDRAPDLRVLATSRELLSVRGEFAVAVAPLSASGRGGRGPAVDLFLDRAVEAAPELRLGEEHIDVVRAVCDRLDGLPLAIELAAARLRSVSLHQLASRLDDRFRLLTGGSRGAPDRQRTLEAVVSWSYDLLDDDERRLLRALSDFPDDFPLAAVQAVAALDAVEAVDRIGRLVDKSLVMVSPSGDTYRYRMLETLRQFGRERLVEHDEAELVRRRMLSWVMELTEDLEQAMRTDRQDAALRAVLPERATARVAADWAAGDGDCLSALRIVASIPCLPTARRLVRLRDLSTQVADLPPQVDAHVLMTRANLAMEVGDWQDSVAATRASGHAFAALGDECMAAWAEYFQGFGMLAMDEDPAVVERLARDSRLVFERVGDRLGTAYALWLGSLVAGDPEAGLADVVLAEELFRAVDSPFGLAHALEWRALTELRAGRAPGGAALDEALSILSDVENGGCIAHALEATAAVLVDRGDHVTAARLVGAAARLRAEVGQDHRPWERVGHEHTVAALESRDPNEIGRAREAGGHLSMGEAVALARSALEAEGELADA